MIDTWRILAVGICVAVAVMPVAYCAAVDTREHNETLRHCAEQGGEFRHGACRFDSVLEVE